MKVCNRFDNDLSLNEQWNEASELLSADVMRPVRYGKCYRYLKDLQKESRLLEVGCGEGTGLWLARQLGFKNLTGVEVSENRLNNALVRLGPTVSLRLVGTDCLLPFDDNTFDIIVSAAVIEHTVDPVLFIREITRVARPGACIVISSDCWQWRILQILHVYKSVQPIDHAMLTSKIISIIEQSNLCLFHFDGFALPHEEYRFVRMIVYSVTGPLLRGLNKMARMLNSSFKPVCSARSRLSDLDQFLDIVKQPWNQTGLIKRYCLSMCSDENVFFCKKR